MRIIHYIPTIDRNSGGLGAYIQLLSKELGKLVDLHIVTHESENMLEIENATLHLIDGRLTHLLKAKRQFVVLLQGISPDLVHVNCCWTPQCALVQFCTQCLGYKVLLMPHGMLEPWILKKNRWLKKEPALWLYQKRAVQKADVLLATAESEKQNLLRLGWNEQVYVIPNGIVVDDIECKQSWKQTKCIFFLALLRPNKGAHLLIEAVAQLKDEMRGWNIVIAGKDDDRYAAYLNQLIAEYRLEEMISLPGALYGEDKWNMYRKADFFVLPTLNENFGIVIAEALLCGTPVITCKGAPWNVLVDNHCGWWVERSVEDIADALSNAIGLQENEIREMGMRGRELVLNNYASGLVAKQIMGVYKSLL